MLAIKDNINSAAKCIYKLLLYTCVSFLFHYLVMLIFVEHTCESPCLSRNFFVFLVNIITIWVYDFIFSFNYPSLLQQHSFFPPEILKHSTAVNLQLLLLLCPWSLCNMFYLNALYPLCSFLFVCVHRLKSLNVSSAIL